MGDTKLQDLHEIAECAAPWVGREEEDTDEVAGQSVRRLAATLDLPTAGFRNGSALPDGWHVALFPPLAPTSELGPDGHPKKGEFLPDLPLPRRMFAERRVIFRQPLHIGDPVVRKSRIAAVEPKQGRSGLLAFVTVVHDFHGPDGVALTEEQKIVYREEAKQGTSPAAKGETPEGTFLWSRTVTPSPALLFRYSAVTFNAHRIHYDGAYTQQEEGYPERVVNGGLTATLMLTFASEVRPGALREFRIRNKRPLFVNRPVTLLGRPLDDDGEGERAEFCAVDDQGFVCSAAILEWKSEA